MNRPVQTNFYIPGFDYLRIAAIFGVVWIHGSDTNPLAKSMQGYTVFAVPCFVMLTAYLTQLSLIRKPHVTYRGLLRSRLVRLIPAYIAWSALYVLARWGKNELLTETPIDFNWLLIIFGGGASYQLWFIPALILWTFIFGGLAVWLTKRANSVITASVLIVVSFMAIPLAHEIAESLVVSENASLITKSTIKFLGYFSLAMGLALMSTLPRSGGDHKSILPGRLGVLLLVPLILILYLGKDLGLFYTPLLSLVLLIQSLSITRKISSKLLRNVASNAYGIYLCHALFVEGAQLVFHQAGLSLESFSMTVLVIGLAFVASAFTCELLSRSRKSRWLVV